ncbi:MAG: alcohol dehydrogenase catalytic domain-containing protein [Opitutales bacterium]|nr:alcohol dehydrogenase catalytic domain-containing protein [Opitutales bacterium]
MWTAIEIRGGPDVLAGDCMLGVFRFAGIGLSLPNRLCINPQKKPKNMRAAVVEEFKKPLKIWTDWKDPEIGLDQAIIKIMANGICRSEWHLWQGHWEWMGFSPPLPAVLGHESAGIIEEVGANVKRFKKGDRVVFPFGQACGCCSTCSDGHQNVCENLAMSMFMGSWRICGIQSCCVCGCKPRGASGRCVVCRGREFRMSVYDGFSRCNLSRQCETWTMGDCIWMWRSWFGRGRYSQRYGSGCDSGIAKHQQASGSA